MAAQNDEIEWPSHFLLSECPVEGLFSGANQILKLVLNIGQSGG